MLISKASACSQGALVLEVLVQEGPPALVDDVCTLVSEGCLNIS